MQRTRKFVEIEGGIYGNAWFGYPVSKKGSAWCAEDRELARGAKDVGQKMTAIYIARLVRNGWPANDSRPYSAWRRLCAAFRTSERVHSDARALLRKWEAEERRTGNAKIVNRVRMRRKRAEAAAKRTDENHATIARRLRAEIRRQRQI